MYLFLDCQDYTHNLSCSETESQLTAFFIRQIDRPLKERRFGSYFDKVSKKVFSTKNAIISYVREIRLRGDTLAARSL